MQPSFRILWSALLTAVCMQAAAWTSPVEVPDLAGARLRIVGQNARNYLTDFTATNADVTTQAEFEQKTNKMANALLALQPDIVAVCEVQEDDEILGYITAEMNRLAQTDVYTYVLDGLQATQSASGYMPLKSGFIYRSDKVTPYGANTSPYTGGNYKARMRIQAFQEISTEEVFVLSMNHFKAKSNSDPDDTEATRLQNVDRLLTALGKVRTDPDILIMGDLNAYPGEAPIENLVEAGYEEQLLRFDPDAYSYVYRGEPGLLDHAMANTTMAGQITDAATYHINTSGSYSYRYSDHDAYVVALCLGAQSCGEGNGIDPIQTAPRAVKALEDGQLVLRLPDGRKYNIIGLEIR